MKSPKVHRLIPVERQGTTLVFRDFMNHVRTACGKEGLPFRGGLSDQFAGGKGSFRAKVTDAGVTCPRCKRRFTPPQRAALAFLLDRPAGVTWRHDNRLSFQPERNTIWGKGETLRGLLQRGLVERANGSAGHTGAGAFKLTAFGAAAARELRDTPARE